MKKILMITFILINLAACSNGPSDRERIADLETQVSYLQTQDEELRAEIDSLNQKIASLEDNTSYIIANY